MKRQYITIIFVTALISLAGCSAVVPGGNQPKPYTETSEKYLQKNPKSTHLDELQTHNSWTMEINRKQTSNQTGITYKSHTTFKIDFSSGSYHKIVNSKAGYVETYYGQGKISQPYQMYIERTQNSPVQGEARYRTVNQLSTSYVTGSQFITPPSKAVNLKQKETLVMNGTPVTKYVGQSTTGGTLTYYVTNQGLIKKFHYKQTTQTGTNTFTLTYTNLDSTDVQAPEWLSVAQKTV